VRLQGTKIIQLGLSTIIPILRNPITQDREKTLKLPSYLKPICKFCNIQNHLYEQRVVKSHLSEHLSTE